MMPACKQAFFLQKRGVPPQLPWYNMEVGTFLNAFSSQNVQTPTLLYVRLALGRRPVVVGLKGILKSLQR